MKSVLFATKNVTLRDLKKLHHYYGHTSPKKLLKFLKNAGKDTKDMKSQLEKIENSCESCIRSKRRKRHLIILYYS